MLFFSRVSKSKYKILLICVILAGLFLRLWNFNPLFYFAIDEEKGAYIIKGIAEATHFPSVGHPSSIGFRLGPIFYYLMTPFYKIFPAPVTIGYLSVLTSVMTGILLYKTVKRINIITAIFSVILYSFSYLNVIYERRGWQLSFESPLILLILLSILQLRKGKQKYIFVLTVAIILVTQLEIGLFTLIPFTIIAFYLLKLRLNRKYLIICITGIFLANIGLLWFDVRHEFLNSRYLLNYFRKDSAIRIQPNLPLTGIRSVYLAHNLIPNTLARTIFPGETTNLAIQYANCPQYLQFKQSQIPLFMKISALAVIFFAFYKAFILKKNKSDEAILFRLAAIYFVVHFSAITLYTYVFQGEMAEYYLIPVFMFYFICLGSALQMLCKTKLRFLAILFIFFFTLVNSYTLVNSFHPYGLKHKLEAIESILSKVKDSPFILEAPQTCWSTGGYRYLFTLAGTEPLTSYMDENLSEYYLPDKTSIPIYRVSILTPELLGKNQQKYEEYKNKFTLSSLWSEHFGAIEVHIDKL